MKRVELLRDRKVYIFAVLLIILIIVNLNQWNSRGRFSAAGKHTKSAKLDNSDDPILLADKLKEAAPEFEGEKRNIFTFFDTPQLAAAAQTQNNQPPPPPDPVCGNGACEAGEDQTNCPGDCHPPPPPAPVITLRYIGYLSEPDGSVAFLTDGKEVYMGRVNDVIANQYRVLKITEETVELGLLDNNQSSTIRFQGNKGG
jgi:hypothetical protein